MSFVPLSPCFTLRFQALTVKRLGTGSSCIRPDENDPRSGSDDHVRFRPAGEGGLRATSKRHHGDPATAEGIVGMPAEPAEPGPREIRIPQEQDRSYVAERSNDEHEHLPESRETERNHRSNRRSISNLYAK